MESLFCKHLEDANLVGDKIYPEIAPDNEKSPYLTYMVVTGRPRELPNGSIANVKSRLQVDVYEDSYLKVVELRKKVVASIRDFPLYSSDVNWRAGYEPRVKRYRQIIEFYAKENLGECNGN